MLRLFFIIIKINCFRELMILKRRIRIIRMILLYSIRKLENSGVVN